MSSKLIKFNQDASIVHWVQQGCPQRQRSMLLLQNPDPGQNHEQKKNNYETKKSNLPEHQIFDMLQMSLAVTSEAHVTCLKITATINPHKSAEYCQTL